MTAMRPPYQLELALPIPGRGEAPRRDGQGVETITATAEPESPALTEHLMEAICGSDNIEAALRAVVRNNGAPGVDGITVKQLPGVLKARWSEIEDQLLQGRYQPQPVRRVKIPKPDGGTRNLGIPTVIDRVIQQAVLQRLQPRWDPTFSEHSYGSDRAAPLTRRWSRRKPTSSTATGLSLTLTWPNFSTGLIMTGCLPQWRSGFRIGGFSGSSGDT